MNGWSITVGEMKKALENIPDDYEIVIENCEVGDCEISGAAIYLNFPPENDGVGLIVLGGSQVITSEYNFHERMDAWLWLSSNPVLRWDSQAKAWHT
jgi:hypothetical protein